MHDPATIARGLTKAQGNVLLGAAYAGALSQGQSDRGTLLNFGQPILDWSFRPARLTPLGQQVADVLRVKALPAPSRDRLAKPDRYLE
jgi:hypothetical protein